MLEIWQQFKQTYLIKYWNPIAAVIAAGLISAYYFGVTGTYWAVTGEFTRWGGHLLQAFGVDVSEWSYYKIIGMDGTVFTRIDGVMILGMFAVYLPPYGRIISNGVTSHTKNVLRKPWLAVL